MKSRSGQKSTTPQDVASPSKADNELKSLLGMTQPNPDTQGITSPNAEEDIKTILGIDSKQPQPPSQKNQDEANLLRMIQGNSTNQSSGNMLDYASPEMDPKLSGEMLMRMLNPGAVTSSPPVASSPMTSLPVTPLPAASPMTSEKSAPESAPVAESPSVPRNVTPKSRDTESPGTPKNRDTQSPSTSQPSQQGAQQGDKSKRPQILLAPSFFGPKQK